MDYDIIVIGAGHAGIEAALASARMGAKTLLVTMDAAKIGLMSCNPAIGGVGKGQLVKEIDALGGEMARAADACAIQFRVLNASKGAAVQSSRAQIDMRIYADYMRKRVHSQKNLFIKEAEVKSLLSEDGVIGGVLTDEAGEISARAVIICPGTFLEGIIHVGLKHHSGGRINEKASIGLTQSLRDSGFNLLRFKTGTCARLDRKSIDFSRLIIQDGDRDIRPFSFSTPGLRRKQVPCHITYTNKRTHEIILKNLARSALYSGIIKGTGVRYCPSVEDKIVKFPDRERHQVFLEPQGLDTDEIYPNGLSTSLPEEAQIEMIRSIAGLERAKIIRFGYSIEHTVSEPTQLYPSLESKMIRNLYLAGQINGTTGYEEAAAQGLVAGINAALKVKNKEPLILERANSYIGVLIDDLTTKGTQEPYRMFTSRVEYRLILREDNADTRLSKAGYELGLVSGNDYCRACDKIKAIRQGMKMLKVTRLNPGPEINAALIKLKTSPIKKAVTLEEILKRPQIRLKDLDGFNHARFDMPDSALRGLEIEVKYSGFIERQLKDVERFKNLEKIKLAAGLDYSGIPGLSREIKEKLSGFRPLNLGQASRISGVTPAAILLLMGYLRTLLSKSGHSEARSAEESKRS